MTAHEETLLRSRLADAVTRDFLDGLPDPLPVSVLATRLRVSRTAVMHHVRRGALVATRVDGRWVIDQAASEAGLQRLLAGIRARRPAVRSEAFTRQEAVYVAVRGLALERLADLMEREHTSAEEVVDELLRGRPDEL